MKGGVRNFWRKHSLSVVLFGLFALFLLGQTLTGYRVYNSEQQQHHAPVIAFSEYLQSGHFGEAVFENWESEFLQMAAYVLLTVWLRQKGSSESKKLSGTESVDKDPRESRARKGVPGPVRRGGWRLRVYENSLSLAFTALFLLSISLHAVEGVRQFNQEGREHGDKPISLSEYVRGSQFWFESFQNWQSEFLAVGSIVVLSVYLRQKGSPESKPVDAPHSETGE
jgi:hypothetical protein